MSSLHESKSSSSDLVNKPSGALWAFFIADSLSMPSHWFYDPNNIIKVFGANGITGYIDCPPTHLEAFLAGSSYNPAEKNSTPNYRPADILHKHAKYYKINNSEYDDRSFKNKVEIRDSRGNSLVVSEDSRPHYHTGLKAGENTLQAEIIRLFLQSCVQNNG